MRKITTVLLLTFLFLTVENTNAQFAFNDVYTEHAPVSDLSSMPVAFTKNEGQWDGKTLFKANTSSATFFFGANEVSYLFVRDTEKVIEDERHSKFSTASADDKAIPSHYQKEAQLIKAMFVDANTNPEIIPANQLSHYSNYFYGNDPDRRYTYVPGYSAIVYKDIWPGIDLKYYGNGRSMKYDFIVNPGADITRIKIRYEGVSELAIANTGELQAQTKFGAVYENIPEIYQEVNEAKISIAGTYRLVEPGVFGFEVEDYNPSLTLVIDPELVYSTYLGGSEDERAFGIDLDGSGNIYVAGEVYSSDYPTVDPYNGTIDGNYDVFVTKLPSSGSSLTYSTYIGGTSYDGAGDINVDDSGNMYVTGWTQSTDYPTANAFDSDLDGTYDAFITKLSADGASLVYSTYLGGTGQDWTWRLDIDDDGSAYVTGETYSSDLPTVNAYCDTNSGTWDVFAAKLSPAGNALTYCTYIGGSRNDGGYSIAVDNEGCAYLTGYSYSDNFPTVNAYDDTHDRNHDVFVTKLSTDGSSLIYSTYLGGGGYEYGLGIDVDDSGYAYVTGFTSSDAFPAYNGYDMTHNGNYDAYLTKLSQSGESLIYSTFLGGSYIDKGYDVFVDASGYAYVIGFTQSEDFPTVDPYDDSFNDSTDVFVSLVSPEGTSLDYSTYLGGNNSEWGYNVIVDGLGNTYVTGETYSDDFPVVDAYDNGYNGNGDCFITSFQIPVSVDESFINLPQTYRLMQNYPNPFNNSTVISYNLIQNGHVTLKIYDLLGRYVESIVDENQQAGSHQVIWDADNVSSGVYFYNIQADDYSDSKKMLLIK